MSTHYSRRTFFQQLILSGAALYFIPFIESCDSGSSFEIPEGSGLPPFKTWEEVLHALAHSPDNFPAKRDRLVQEKNPEAMFNFVRDDLGLLPSDRTYFRYLAKGYIYGTQQALRCGMATPREKADILRDMLVEAGFKAKVVTEIIELTMEEVKTILFRKTKTEFNPPISKSQVRKWEKELGVSETQGQLNVIENIVEDAKQLADRLLELVPEAKKQPENETRFLFSNREVPAVVLDLEGKEIVLHLFDPSVPYGSPHPTNTSQKTYDLKDIEQPDPEVKLALRGIKAFDKLEEITFLEATYKTSELLGNQLKIEFLNNLTFEEKLFRTVNSINSFTPSIALQDVNKDAEYLQERTFLGEPITLEGDKVFSEALLYESLNTDIAAGDISMVASLDIHVKPKVYPKLVLEVYPLNTAGSVVEGLAGQQFRLSADGKPVQGFMRQNVISPRILLLYDTSNSMPVEYRGNGIQQFLETTETAIRDIYPHARITLQNTGSSIYTTHLKAAYTNNDLILYATDGHNSDSYNPEYYDIYTSGPPTLYLNVYNNSLKYFDELADKTGAKVIPADDQQQTIELIKQELDSLRVPPYVFELNTVTRELHEIKVELNKAGLSAKTTVTFPPALNNTTGNRLIGLYLDMTIANRKLPRRVLAGLDKLINPNGIPSLEMAGETHEMLLGKITMAFEKAGATTSVRFSEYLKSLLSTRAWMEPYLKGDMQLAAKQIQNGQFDYPSVLLSLMQPLQESVNEESATFVEGIRIGMLKFKPSLDSGNSKVSFDYMRSSNYRTLTRSGKNWFSANARKTAQLALLENQLFPTSTYQLLEGRSLVCSAALPENDTYSSQALGDDYRYWRERVFRGGNPNLMDLKAEQKAFWHLDGNSGELYGILPDFSGGGGESIQAQLDGLQKVIEDYQKVVSAFNTGAMAAGGGLAIGIVAAYSVTLVRLYALASEAIIIMDASGMDEEIAKALAELACNIYKEILYTAIGPVGSGMAGIENLIGMMGGNYSFVDC